MLHGLLLYSNAELHWLRRWGIHLPTYRGEIPVSPAPSYQQARQPEAMKQSPPRAVTPNPSMESPKNIHSSGKGSLHCGLGCSSNTSTPKCPDSTSAEKPSSSKEPTSNGQEKSPKAHGSHKCSHSPSPSAECYIVGLGPNCKFIDLLFKRLVITFNKISSFIVSLF